MKKRLTILLEKVSNNTASEQEFDELLELIRRDDSDAVSKEIHAFYSLAPDATEAYTKEEMDLLFSGLLQAENNKQTIIKKIPVSQAGTPRTHMLKAAWIRYAAILLLVLGAISYQLLQHDKDAKKVSHASRQKQRVLPITQGATLTLADGSTILLDSAHNGAHVQQNGATIILSNGALAYAKTNTVMSDPSALNTISTPRGKLYQLSLPDGSNVWLNAESSLTFPVRFDSKERRVTLTGEAYFEIAKQEKPGFSNHILAMKRVPFIVQTAAQQIEVLGTHFNVNAYANESFTKTTLLEGSVKINYSNGNAGQVTLVPGEEAFLQNNTNMKVSKADVEQSVAWKNGLLIFSGQSLEEIMRMMERWYNVQVEFKNEQARHQVFEGSVTRFSDIRELLKVLEAAGSSVHFKLEGSKIIVQ